MLRSSCLAAAFVTLAACTGPRTQNPSANGAVFFATPVVLFVSPDSLEIRRLQDRLGDDFHVVADDAMWYRAAAYELLDSLRIPSAAIDGRSARFIVAGVPRMVSWDTIGFAWFTLIYDGETEPRIAADIDLPEVLSSWSRW